MKFHQNIFTVTLHLNVVPVTMGPIRSYRSLESDLFMTGALHIRAVFFDLGGTLFQHLPAAHTQHNLIAVMDSLKDRQPADNAAIWHSYRRHRRQLEDEGQYQAFFMHRGLVAEAMRRTLAEYDIVAPAAAAAFCDAQRASVTQHLQLRADTISTLEQLQQQGVYRAIVSNIDDDYIVPLLRRTGLAQYLEHWLSSERARSCKPHAGIFRQAMASAGHAPDQVLFVGDSYANDVLGASRLGMKTALLTTDLDEPLPPGADFYIESLAELLAIIPAR